MVWLFPISVGAGLEIENGALKIRDFGKADKADLATCHRWHGNLQLMVPLFRQDKTKWATGAMTSPATPWRR